MLALFQIAVLCLILATAGAWVTWVRSTQFTVSTPSKLGEVIVVGTDANLNAPLSRALGLGIAGAVAEHRREVDMINRAATLKDRPGITALDRVSTPMPDLLTASAPRADFDLKFEAFGSSVDAKGLRGLMNAFAVKPDTMQVTVLLDEKLANQPYQGLATASFGGDKDYGFSLDITGTPQQISYLIAMRHLQALYGKGDALVEALPPEDFRMFWRVRREAATIARRRSATDNNDSDNSQRQSAQAAITLIEPLAMRYPGWSDVQKIKGYLASVLGDFGRADAALVIAESASTITQAETARISRARKGLVLDQRAKSPVSLARGNAVSAGREPGSIDIAAQDALTASAATAVVAKAQQSRRLVRVGILLAAPSDFPQFPNRIEAIDATGTPARRGTMEEHANSLVGLIAALAPTARIEVVSVLGDTGVVSSSDLLRGLERLGGNGWPDVVFIGMGPLNGQVFLSVFERIARSTLVVLPAGNDSGGELLLGADLDNLLYVGALAPAGDVRAAYSNFGSSVKIYAPGTVLSYATPSRLREVSGTSPAAAIAAAAAANLFALSEKPLSPAELKARLIAGAGRKDGLAILKFLTK